MTKISKEEYYTLKSLGNKRKWIARDLVGDHGGDLFVYPEKPFKNHYSGGWVYGRWFHSVDNHLFQFVQWEDEDPYNIQELVQEYEYSAEHVSYPVNERVKALGRAWSESEETEMKSKQDLIEKWESAIEAAEFYGKGKEERLISYMKGFVSDLNQLDEPETLSSDWIDKHKYRYDNVELVGVKDLQNLLVPKQEEITEEQAWETLSDIYDIRNERYIREAMRVVAKYVEDDMTIGELKRKFSKPVVPEIVADYIPLAKEEIDLVRVAYYATTNNELPKWKREYGWIRENFETFVKAWLAYPNIEVEEEQKYYVLNNEGETMIRKDDSGVGTSSGFKIENWLSNEGYKLTEREIKDYDERYFAFAVKVEELGE